MAMTNLQRIEIVRKAGRVIASTLRVVQRITGYTIRSVSIERDRETMRSDAGKMTVDVIVNMSEGA
jgi:hypothetical protein